MTVYKVGRRAEVRRGGGAKKVTFKKHTKQEAWHWIRRHHVYTNRHSLLVKGLNNNLVMCFRATPKALLQSQANAEIYGGPNVPKCDK